MPDSSDAGIDDRARLLRFTDVAGSVFGTEDFGLFLHAHVRMSVPEVVVELGTGLGVSAFWMALAAKRNGVGHVWSVDDLALFRRDAGLIGQLTEAMRVAHIRVPPSPTPQECFTAISTSLQLHDSLTFVRGVMDLSGPWDFTAYPFGDQPIDLLFADFRHGPEDILAILGQFLPKMSPASSMFIDSASTYWPSYMLLEHLARDLNTGRIPRALHERSSIDLAPYVRDRRFVLVHLTEKKDRSQNSTAWLKLEPCDIQPQPTTAMRGF